MFGTYIEDYMERFRRSPNDQGTAKAAINELNVLIDRITRAKKIHREDLKYECEFLEVVRCIKNQRLHFHERAGLPLFNDAEQTGFFDVQGNLVCQTLNGEIYKLIDVAETSFNFLKKYT